MPNIGIDIEDVSRFEKKDYENHLNFYKKIFTENEIQYCLKKTNPYKHFAVRFCAKEAAIKASSKKITNLKTIEITVIDKKPTIKFPHNEVGLVSLSHTDKYAIAVVLILP